MGKPWRFVANARPDRRHDVWRLQRFLEQVSWPRLQMALLAGLTGGTGLVASWLLLDLGMGSMALRYALSVLIAYAVFLVLLWLWVRLWLAAHLDPSGAGRAFEYVERRSGSSARATDTNGSFVDSARDEVLGHAFEAGARAVIDQPARADGSGALDALDGGDDAAVPLVVLLAMIAAGAAVVLALLSVISAAPLLFAELLFDAVLSVGLYRHLRRRHSSHWLRTAVRHTGLAFLLTLALCAFAGGLLQHFAPEAVTLGGALDALIQPTGMERAGAQSK